MEKKKSAKKTVSEEVAETRIAINEFKKMGFSQIEDQSKKHIALNHENLPLCLVIEYGEGISLTDRRSPGTQLPGIFPIEDAGKIIESLKKEKTIQDIITKWWSLRSIETPEENLKLQSYLNEVKENLEREQRLYGKEAKNDDDVDSRVGPLREEDFVKIKVATSAEKYNFTVRYQLEAKNDLAIRKKMIEVLRPVAAESSSIGKLARNLMNALLRLGDS